MPVSHENECIFVHIPKNAGTSIERALDIPAAVSARQKKRVLIGRIPKSRHWLGWPGKQHSSEYYQHLLATEIRSKLGADIWNRYFSFAFVRNPWDRLVASFSKKDPGLMRGARAQGIDLETSDFRDFVFRVHKVKHSHLFPQSDYLLDESGNHLVDFIGRFENLDADFQSVSQRIGIQDSLPRLNTSIRRDYRDYYDDETMNEVARIYREDIERFQFRFDTRTGR